MHVAEIRIKQSYLFVIHVQGGKRVNSVYYPYVNPSSSFLIRLWPSKYSLILPEILFVSGCMFLQEI